MNVSRSKCLCTDTRPTPGMAPVGAVIEAYRAVGESCVAVDVPANGFLADASYGPGWKCDRGYQEVDSSCIAVLVPEHAHLDYSGNDWDCDDPYRKQRDHCELPTIQLTAR